MRTYYKAGTWNALCDRCGFEHKSDALKQEWTGLMVCGPCYETRHPQDLLRVPREATGVPWTRPSPPDVFTEITCDLWSRQGRADFGSAGCATVGFTTPIEILIDIFAPTSRATLAIAGRSIAGVI